MLPIIKNLELLPIKAKKIKVINSKLKKPERIDIILKGNGVNAPIKTNKTPTSLNFWETRLILKIKLSDLIKFGIKLIRSFKWLPAKDPKYHPITPPRTDVIVVKKQILIHFLVFAKTHAIRSGSVGKGITIDSKKEKQYKKFLALDVLAIFIKFL